MVEVSNVFKHPDPDCVRSPDVVPLVEVLPSEEVDDGRELELDRDWDHLLTPGIHR